MNSGSPRCEGGASCQADKGFSGGSNEELTTWASAPSKPRVDNRLLEGFRGWLRGRVSGETADYYVGVVEWASGRLGGASMLRPGAVLGMPSLPKTAGSGRHCTVEAVPIETIREYKDILGRAGAR